MKVIAVDFDGTLCESKWPEIGKPNWPIIHELIRRQADGDRIILWTCRTGERLEEAVLWCVNHRLRFDAVNENLPERIEQYGSESRKVIADEYWDDRAVVIGSTLRFSGRGAMAGEDALLPTAWEAAAASRAARQTGRRLGERIRRWFRKGKA